MIDGLLGIIGGVIFLSSWILQAYQTKKNKKPTFSNLFFIVRIIGSVLLVIESIRVTSVGLFLVHAGTALIMVYNIYKNA